MYLSVNWLAGLAVEINNSSALSTATALVGSPIPYSGTLSDTASSSLNIGATLPNKSTLYTWDSTAQKFIQINKQANPTTYSTNVTIGVAEGFFVIPKSATNWVQSVP